MNDGQEKDTSAESPTSTDDTSESIESTSGSIDYSAEQTRDSSVGSFVVGGTYDPRPYEDTARRYIAYLLIGLLWLVVAGMLVLISFEVVDVTELKDFAVVLGPIVTLVSAATGFYYGTKNSS